MKLLYYSPHPNLQLNASTGYGTHMREMIAAFRRQGVEVKTLIAGDLKHSGNIDHPTNIRSEGKGMRNKIKSILPPIVWESLKDLGLLLFDQSMERRLKKAIRDFNPDVVYERIAYIQNSGVKVCKEMKVFHISEVNAPYPDERKYFSGASAFIGFARNNLRYILVHTNLVVPVSSSLAEHLSGVATDAASKTHVQPNAVNPAEVVHGADRIQQVRNELQLDDCLVFGFVGSIFPYHGVDLLIEAFAKLPAAPKAKLLIVGDGASLPELKALAQRLGVLKDVIFTGGVPHRDVYLYMEVMDVCCLVNTIWYASPVKIFEYGLLKKAVIAPDVQPVRDVMDNQSAILVKPDTASIKDAMLRLMGDESLRLRLADAWHRKVLTVHTWDKAAKNILEYCE